MDEEIDLFANFRFRGKQIALFYMVELDFEEIYAYLSNVLKTKTNTKYYMCKNSPYLTEKHTFVLIDFIVNSDRSSFRKVIYNGFRPKLFKVKNFEKLLAGIEVQYTNQQLGKPSPEGPEEVLTSRECEKCNKIFPIYEFLGDSEICDKCSDLELMNDKAQIIKRTIDFLDPDGKMGKIIKLYSSYNDALYENKIEALKSHIKSLEYKNYKLLTYCIELRKSFIEISSSGKRDGKHADILPGIGTNPESKFKLYLLKIGRVRDLFSNKETLSKFKGKFQDMFLTIFGYSENIETTIKILSKRMQINSAEYIELISSRSIEDSVLIFEIENTSAIIKSAIGFNSLKNFLTEFGDTRGSELRSLLEIDSEKEFNVYFTNKIQLDFMKMLV